MGGTEKERAKEREREEEEEREKVRETEGEKDGVKERIIEGGKEKNGVRERGRERENPGEQVANELLCHPRNSNFFCEPFSLNKNVCLVETEEVFFGFRRTGRGWKRPHAKHATRGVTEPPN